MGGLARGAQPPRVHSAEVGVPSDYQHLLLPSSLPLPQRSPPRHRSRAPDAREREPRDGYSRPERSGWDDRPPREAAPFSDRDRDRDRGGYRASPPRGREAVAPSREWRDSPPRARRGEREREHASLAEAYIPPRIPPPWERRDPYENDAFNKLPDAEARPAYGGRQDEPPRGGGAYRDAPPGRYYEETERYAPPRAGGYGGGYGASPPRYESVRDGAASPRAARLPRMHQLSDLVPSSYIRRRARVQRTRRTTMILSIYSTSCCASWLVWLECCFQSNEWRAAQRAWPYGFHARQTICFTCLANAGPLCKSVLCRFLPPLIPLTLIPAHLFDCAVHCFQTPLPIPRTFGLQTLGTGCRAWFVCMSPSPAGGSHLSTGKLFQ